MKKELKQERKDNNAHASPAMSPVKIQPNQQVLGFLFAFVFVLFAS